MANPSVTYTFIARTLIEAAKVNQNFADLISSMIDGTKAFAIEALTCNGNVNLKKNVILGDSSARDLTISASLASSLAYKTNNVYDIGAATLAPASIYLGAPSSRSTRLLANQSLTASNTLVLPDGNGTANQVLKTDGSGNLSWTTVSATEIADGSVTTAKIADNNVTTVKIADANVTTIKIADANITTAKIADGNVTPAKLSNNLIASGTVSGVTLAGHFVDGLEVTITNVGRPIMIAIRGTSLAFGSRLVLYEGDTPLFDVLQSGTTYTNEILTLFEFAAAGSHRYRFRPEAADLVLNSVKLYAFEL